MDIIADYCIAEHNVRVVFAENGNQPQKENQQEKKGGMFHLEILCL